VKSFLLRFFTVHVEPSCFTSSVVKPWGNKAGVVTPIQPTSSHTISHRSSASFPTAEKKEENKEIDLKENKRGLLSLQGASLFPFFSMAESGWPASEITQEHLQNLVRQGYMTTTELATCRVPTDPTSPVPVGGYIIVCSMLYEQGFGTPSHRFLCLLL
jgi:hypothetical protein